MKATLGIFSSGKPSATSEARPKVKNLRGCRPRGFLALDLASDVALGLLSENPLGGLQSTPRAKIEFSRDRPRAQIHLATPSAGPQIVPVYSGFLLPTEDILCMTKGWQKCLKIRQKVP